MSHQIDGPKKEERERERETNDTMNSKDIAAAAAR